MTESSIEARLRGALAEVAGRIEVADAPVPYAAGGADSGSSHPRRWVLGAAALVVTVLGIAYGLSSSTDGSDRGVVAGPSEKREVLIETTLEGETVQLEGDPAAGCVHLKLSYDGPSYPDSDPRTVCLPEGRLYVGLTLRAGQTLVYGLTSELGELRVTVKDEGVAPPVVLTAAMGTSQVFLALVKKPLATGSVEILDRRGRTVTTSQFEKGGPKRPAKRPAGSAKPLLVYLDDGAVWARLDDGRTIRMSDGIPEANDGYPFVSPDGATILFTVVNFEGIFDSPSTIDVPTGSIREVPRGGMRFQSDGRFVAGFVPRDDSIDAEISVSSVGDYREVRRLTIPDSSNSEGGQGDMVWLGDGSLLVVLSSGIYLASVDSSEKVSGTLTKLRYDGDPTALAITEPTSDSNRIPALRTVGSRVELGELSIQGGVVRFNKTESLPTSVGKMPLVPDRLRLDRSRRSLRQAADGRIEVAKGLSPAYVISDGHNVFQYTDGKLTLLLPGVEFASAP